MSVISVYVIELFPEATGNAFPVEYLEMIQDSVPFAFEQGGSRIKLSHHVWQKSKSSYELVFTINKGEATDDQ